MRSMCVCVLVCANKEYIQTCIQNCSDNKLKHPYSGSSTLYPVVQYYIAHHIQSNQPSIYKPIYIHCNLLMVLVRLSAIGICVYDTIYAV